jgi:hypothetical protein
VTGDRLLAPKKAPKESAQRRWAISLGAVFAVLGIGLLIGFLGRLVMPGRHGLVLVVLRDLKLLPRIVIGTVPGRGGVVKVIARDLPLRWCLVSGIAGGFAGYLIGRGYLPTDMNWIWAISGAIVVLAVLMPANTIKRTMPTRRLGVHPAMA